jgi:hypothetical protein
MHTNNCKWLDELKTKYPKSFTGKVLELGSFNVSGAVGTIRPWFNATEYVGVDMEAGDCVDVVCDAEKTEFQPEQFDTLAIFSLFEHTTRWREILKHNLQWLKKGGMIFTCFGAEGNEPHMVETCGWWLVPHQDFLDYCKTLNLEIVDSFFEEERFGKDCAGAYDVCMRRKV